MPFYTPFKFECTVGVSRTGDAYLMSKLPEEFEGPIVEPGSDDLISSGWDKLPDQTGLWDCTVSVAWSCGDCPTVYVLDYKPASAVIEEVTEVISSAAAYGTGHSLE